MTCRMIANFFLAFFTIVTSLSSYAAHAYRVETSNLPKEYRASKQKYYLLFEAKDKAHPLKRHSDIVLYFQADIEKTGKLSKQRAYKFISDKLEKKILPDALETTGSNYLFASIGHEEKKLPGLLYDRIRKKGLHQPIYATVSLSVDSFTPVKQAIETKGFFQSASVFLSDDFSTTSQASKNFLEALYRDGHELRGKTQVNLIFVGKDLRAKKHQLNTLLSHLKKLGISYTTNILVDGNNEIKIHKPRPFLNKKVSWSQLIAAEAMKNKKLSQTLPSPNQKEQQTSKNKVNDAAESQKDDFPQGKPGGIGTQNMNTQGLGDAILEFGN